MASQFGLQWHITNRCDQRCTHCYIFNATGEKVSIAEFELERAKEIVDKFIAFCKSVGRIPTISITGGDPLHYPYIWEVLRYLRDSDIRYTILGNPFHLNKEVAEMLFNLGCKSYQMSLDGLRKTHDLIRKPGSFDVTFEKIGVLKSAGIRANIMTTVSALNYKEVPALTRLVTDAGVNVHAFARYCPTHADLEYNLSPKEYRNFLAEMWKVYSELVDSGTTFTLKDHLWILFLYENGKFTPITGDVVYEGCACGISHITLLEDGIVYACRRFTSPIGNIYESDFATLFWGKEMCEYRNINRLEGCKDCVLLNHCRGCHAVAAGTSGNFFQRDPQCWK
jgi:radical SAM/SPASM domain protein of ACGX system